MKKAKQEWYPREVHEIALMFPLLEEGEFKEFVQNIADSGIKTEIYTFEGKIADGRHRELAFRQLRDEGTHVTPPIYTALEDRGIDTKEKALAFVKSLNVRRRHLTREQKDDLIDKLIMADPTRSDLSIAKEAKVSDKTVTNRRRKLEGRSEIPNVKTKVDARGRKVSSRKKVSPKVKKPKFNFHVPTPVAPEDVRIKAVRDVMAMVDVTVEMLREEQPSSL